MKIKLPKNKKRVLKIFGMILGVTLLAGTVDAILKPTASKPLPVSKISDEFPKSYQIYIERLKQIYPNATFKAVYTGLDWTTLLEHETYDKSISISLVPKSYPDEWKKTSGKIAVDGSFVTASKSAVAYVIDPRNSLFETRIFQFEGLSYNPNITTTVIEKIISKSPMVGEYERKYKNAGKWIDMDLSYTEIIEEVAKKTQVSSVYIASRMIQETSGNIITNESVNGSNSTYPGVYNFFNIGAVPNANGKGSVENGLKHAKTKGWTTPYLSILGGVEKIKSNYIKWGQDTVYFQKFDVNNPEGKAEWLMGTQYQTNILAPISESKISYDAYKKLDMLDTAFIFYIPVYENMPEDPTPYPAGDDAKFVDDNTKIYFEHPDNKSIAIRTSANSEIPNIIYELTKEELAKEEKIIATRIKQGNGYGWDLVEFEKDGEKIKGYVWGEQIKVYEYMKVESVSLDKEAAELEVDDKLTLVATVLPENAEFKEITWTSSNNEILTVEAGVLTAKTPGEVVVTATTEDGFKIATCMVNVKEKTHDIQTDLEEYIVEEGTVVIPSVTLKNIEDYELKVVDETIAKVVDKTIETLMPGETTIEIKGIGTDIVKTVKLVVTEKEYKIETDQEEYTMEVDSTAEPIITLKNIEEYTLEIVDTNIAVIEDKYIKGVAAGETTLRIQGTGTEVVKEVKIIVIPKEYKIETDQEEYIIKVDNIVEPVVTLKNIEEYALEIVDTNIAVIEDKYIKGVAAGETTLRIQGTGTEVVKEVKIVVIPNESYIIDESIKLDEVNKCLSGISETTTVGAFKSKFEVVGLVLEFKDVNNKVLTDEEYVGTGTTISFLREDGSEYDKLTVVIYGDVDGDGCIFPVDYVLIKNYIMSDGELTNVGEIAADVTRDTYVYPNDYVVIKNYIMGEGDIAQ